MTATLGANGNTGNLNIAKFNSVSSFSANYVVPGAFNPPNPIFIKVVNDGTNLKWYFSPNGLDFILLQSALKGDWLSTITAVGFFADSNNSTYDSGVLLVSWTQGTS